MAEDEDSGLLSSGDDYDEVDDVEGGQRSARTGLRGSFGRRPVQFMVAGAALVVVVVVPLVASRSSGGGDQEPTTSPSRSGSPPAAPGGVVRSIPGPQTRPDAAVTSEWDDAARAELNAPASYLKTSYAATGIGYACFEDSVELEGHDIVAEGVKADTAEECKVLCTQTASCLYFTWQRDTRLCFPKTSDIGRRSWGKRVSGPLRCTGVPTVAVSEAIHSLADAGFCNTSVPPVPDVAPRQHHMTDEVRKICVENDDKAPPSSWKWPGRNWCWVHIKRTACYWDRYSDETLPNWWWAQEKNSKWHAAPKPTDYLFTGLENPALCDLPQNGAHIDASAEEMAEAKAWVAKNLAVYVVNLDTAKKRWQSMSGRLSSLGLNATRIAGIDLSKLGLEGAKAKGYIPQAWNYTQAKAMVKRMMNKSSEHAQDWWLIPDAIGLGTVGCAAAHLNAQRRAAQLASAEGKQLALILEDDIWIEDDFALRLRRLLRDEAPCDWEAISLSSRCTYGVCVSPHLSRVQPDGNEPALHCHAGTNFGFFGMLYRTNALLGLNQKLMMKIWDEATACVPVDSALAAISDQVNFYAVPHSQKPGFMSEVTDGSMGEKSTRISANYKA
eukprot:TRINITY_DN41355_c0_g1_i1.p1 TRINITY_DN41355_c0_g1~~TRINITY_DN41355_c0_g1_i1.p1  ORF type:complete len:612 (+),score=130.96 TRINITY_DN41355_c0_g1_i1:84-1919(+)